MTAPGSDSSAARPVPRLEVKGVTKRFPGVLANDHVDFAVAPGEVHALLGENGAGKSTLVKMIYGVLHPDEGTLAWNGAVMQIADPHAARALGIGMVFQHFSLFEAMTVLENIALGMDKPGDMALLSERVRDVSEAYGLPLDPDRDVYTLSVGERQRIEIVRCLLQNPKLLIMDEPTSVLTPQEVERLFETLRKLAAEGVSILYISHKLEEIKQLCDRATILRGGRVVAECDPAQETAKSMAQMMIGTELKTVERRAEGVAGEARLVVEGLTLASEEIHGVDLKNVSFAVRAGEIFGIAGVAGNGQNELLLGLSGERLADHESVLRIDGAPAGRSNAGARRKLGLCAVPEERNGHGAVPGMTLVENAVLSGHHRMGLLSSLFIRAAAAARFAQQIVTAFDVRTPGVTASAGSLSGGNLQKFIVGREILQKPKVLVVSQPTWGVDAGAAAAIHQALADLAAEGVAVVVVSQDLDELLAITDRLAVINVGVLSSAMLTREASVEEIGLLMGGVHGVSTDAAVVHPEAAHVA
ncbi:ABC transporter ATP-binding protein [Pelagibius sp.]|uniref:ABC transporter ATP-binding protein n=1 Tax=Pelagibius sp. TaxID=1931238 RepID=UPI00261124E3|nr:ABC transporter ATP-binding protein [Pelagibius sp.]